MQADVKTKNSKKLKVKILVDSECTHTVKIVDGGLNVKIVDGGLYFSFFILLYFSFSFSFFNFLFLEQLGLGVISHAVTSVTKLVA